MSKKMLTKIIQKTKYGCTKLYRDCHRNCGMEYQLMICKRLDVQSKTISRKTLEFRKGLRVIHYGNDSFILIHNNENSQN